MVKQGGIYRQRVGHISSNSGRLMRLYNCMDISRRAPYRAAFLLWQRV